MRLSRQRPLIPTWTPRQPGPGRVPGGVPAGRIVAVAAADEASRLLGQEAVEALRGIGAEGDLREKFRWGHAIIGVQGAAPGTALEAMDWMRPVSVVVGEGATEPGWPLRLRPSASGPIKPSGQRPLAL